MTRREAMAPHEAPHLERTGMTGIEDGFLHDLITFAVNAFAALLIARGVAKVATAYFFLRGDSGQLTLIIMGAWLLVHLAAKP